MSLVDLVISCSFIVLCCILAQTARKIIHRVSSINGFVKELIFEAIAAAELCSTCFELIIGENARNLRIDMRLWLSFFNHVNRNSDSLNSALNR